MKVIVCYNHFGFMANFNMFNSLIIYHPRELEPIPADAAQDVGYTLHRSAFHHRVEIKTQVVPHPVEMLIYSIANSAV